MKCDCWKLSCRWNSHSFNFIKVLSEKDLSCCRQVSWQARPPWEEKRKVFLLEASEALKLLILYNKNSEADF